MARIRGDKDQFWAAASVGIGGKSAVVNVGREINQIVIYVTSSATTTITVEAIHQGDITSEGILPDVDDPGFAGTAFPLFYLDSTQTPIKLVVTAGTSAALMIPDVGFQFCRLSSSAAATITAGWSGSP